MRAVLFAALFVLPAFAQPAPPAPAPQPSQPSQPDCQCGVPDSPRGPR